MLIKPFLFCEPFFLLNWDITYLPQKTYPEIEWRAIFAKSIAFNVWTQKIVQLFSKLYIAEPNSSFHISRQKLYYNFYAKSMTIIWEFWDTIKNGMNMRMIFSFLKHAIFFIPLLFYSIGNISDVNLFFQTKPCCLFTEYIANKPICIVVLFFVITCYVFTGTSTNSQKHIFFFFFSVR